MGIDKRTWRNGDTITVTIYDEIYYIDRKEEGVYGLNNEIDNLNTDIERLKVHLKGKRTD